MRQHRTIAAIVVGIAIGCSTSAVVAHQPPMEEWKRLVTAITSDGAQHQLVKTMHYETLQWETPGAARWPAKLYRGNQRTALAQSIRTFFRTFPERGSIHDTLSSAEFFASTCTDGPNPYRGHWLVEHGDQIRAHSGLQNGSADDIRYCRKRYQPAACEKAYAWSAAYTMTYQGHTTSLAIGLRCNAGVCRITDVAFADLCDL